MRQQTTPGCERACVPYANGMLHNASGETIGEGQNPPPCGCEVPVVVAIVCNVPLCVLLQISSKP